MLIFAVSTGFSHAQGNDAEIQRKLDNVLPQFNLQYEGSGQLSNTQSLPTADLKTQVIPNAIKLFLMLAGSVSFIVFVYAGVMLIMAQGKEEEITKFKNILIWSLVGLLFITLSYGIVSGIMRLSFT